MKIGLYYLKNKKNLAAMKRYNIVIEKHSKSKFVPEALYRLVEIYYTLGLEEDAYKSAAVIGYNYPTSKWYRYSYNILDKNKSNSKIGLKKKIINFFNNEEN
jgi:outer membrane protein assembly factor BamD